MWTRVVLACAVGSASTWQRADAAPPDAVTFTRVTAGNIVTDVAPSGNASWADYDADGDLDLFVSTGDNPTKLLYRNNGNGTFTKITTGNIVTDRSNSQGAVWGDYDNDGNGRFSRLTIGNIVNDGGNSDGAAWADYDNDGNLDLFVANDNGQKNFLYHNNADGTFTKIISGRVVTDVGNSSAGSWGDYDNDGDL